MSVCVSEEEGRSEAQKGWFMFRGGRVLGWGTSGHLGSDVTAGGVSEGGAWTIIKRSSLTHRPQLPSSCAYQPPSIAGVRLAAARVLGRAVASLSLDTAQQSARAKARPRACCWSLPRAQDPQCSQSRASIPTSLQMQVRTARNAAPECIQ